MLLLSSKRNAGYCHPERSEAQWGIFLFWKSPIKRSFAFQVRDDKERVARFAFLSSRTKSRSLSSWIECVSVIPNETLLLSSERNACYCHPERSEAQWGIFLFWKSPIKRSLAFQARDDKERVARFAFLLSRTKRCYCHQYETPATVIPNGA